MAEAVRRSAGGPAAAPSDELDLVALRAAERRVLWLATAIVREHPLPPAVRGAGQPAASAAIASVATALWLGFLDADDRVAIGAYAAPVLRALDHVLGRRDARAPLDVREGPGATAAIWRALARRAAEGRAAARAEQPLPPRGRQIAVVRAAELEAGAGWEALAEPLAGRLGELLWVVVIDPLSLDRVVPDEHAGWLRRAFEAAGWHALTLKYGRRLQELFQRTGGGDLCRRLDELPNEELRRLLAADADQLRALLPGSGRGRRAVARLVSELSDRELAAAIRDLGGHDLGALIDAFHAADRVRTRPSVVFSYAIGGWSLPIEGRDGRTARLTEAQHARLARELGADVTDPWAPPPAGSPEAALWAAAARRLLRPAPAPAPVPFVPVAVRRGHDGVRSTQQAFGRFLADLEEAAPDVAARVVTADAAAFAGLEGWIGKAGLWHPGGDGVPLRWGQGPDGRHVELGAAPENLAGLLAALGETWAYDGAPLLPIGAVAAAQAPQALERLAAAAAAGDGAGGDAAGHAVLIACAPPSGDRPAAASPASGAVPSASGAEPASSAPGAAPSASGAVPSASGAVPSASGAVPSASGAAPPTPGAVPSASSAAPPLGLPGLVAWEPAFAHELEWCLLDALARLGRPGGRSAYVRLSARALDQTLAALPRDPGRREARRREALAGGYRLHTPALAPRVTLVAAGAPVAEALAAARVLANEGGIAAEVVCLTSPDLAFRALQARQGLDDTGDPALLQRLFPPQRPLPLVALRDGAPHDLAFLAAVNATPIACLASPDVETVVGAALDLL